LYANDIAMIAETPVDLLQMLDYEAEWCEVWKMKLNMGKTKVLELR